MGACITCCNRQERQEDIEEPISPTRRGKSTSSENVKRQQTGQHITIKQRISNNDLKIQSQMFINENANNPADSYERVGIIGEGGFSQVIKVRRKNTNEYRAMKIIKKISVNPEFNEVNIFDEINILKKLDHPNIIKIFEFFQDSINFYLITELCEYGDLFENLIDTNDDVNPLFTENIAGKIMKQLLSAIIYLHSQNIIHGDLKLENILINDKVMNSKKKQSNNIDIKLIDFGCSRIFKKSLNLDVEQKILGTMTYLAPEAFQGILDKKNDIWSCGVIMYFLLCGNLPFEGKSDTEVVDHIERGEFDFEAEIFKKISADAKDLIKLMLTLDYNKRIDAKTALKHKWFKNIDEGNLVVDKNYVSEIMNNLKNFQAEHKFQQAVYTYISHNLVARGDIENLRKVFQLLDKDGSGRLDKEELQKGFQEAFGYNLGEYEMQALMKNIDHDNNGYIEYEEFLKAAIGNKVLLSNENLIQAFNVFDADKSGDITTEEIRKIIGGEKGIEEDNFQEIISEIDLDKGDSIDFDRFKVLMKNIRRKSHTFHKKRSNI